MYGYRGKIGVLVPSGITTIEGDFNRMVPEGVSCHYHRYHFTGGRPGDEHDVLQGLQRAGDYIGQAAEVISHVRPNLIVMTGTGTSFVGGHGYDLRLIDLIIEKSGGIPATTTSTAVIAALKKLGVTRISLASPYVEKAARLASEFVEAHGIEVIGSKWLGKAGPEIPAVSHADIYQLVKEVNHPKSQVVFVSCTDLNVLGIVDRLETDLGKPIVTSNQATMWHVLRKIGIKDQLKGFGFLLHAY